MSRHRTGFILAQLMLIIAVGSILLLAASKRRLERVAESRTAYLESAAQELAAGGIEAALSAVHRRREPPRHPLGDVISLSSATATLEVTMTRGNETYELVSCAVAEMPNSRASRPRVERCVDATISDGRRPRVLTWHER